MTKSTFAIIALIFLFSLELFSLFKITDNTFIILIIGWCSQGTLALLLFSIIIKFEMKNTLDERSNA